MSDARRPTLEQLRIYAEKFSESRALRHFGAVISFPSHEEVHIDLEIRPEFRGGLGTDAVNGGVLAAIFDLAIGCTPALVDPTRRTATLQLSMSFMRPVKGNQMRAVGRISRVGSQVLFASASIYDSSGIECAHCQGVTRMSDLTWESPAVP